MKNTWLPLLAILSTTLALTAAPIDFDFKDPKGVNNATFKLDAPLEAITGSANGISGTVHFDPQNPASTQGKIVIAANTLHVGNPLMLKDLRGDKWMGIAKYPEITFETLSLANVKTTTNVTTADVTGKMTIKGVTKELTVPVKITYLKDKLGARIPSLQGDLLVLRANFTINRSDFNIQPGQFEDKVAETIALSLSVSGMSPKK